MTVSPKNLPAQPAQIKKVLRLSFCIAFCFLIVELIAAYYTNSLALLADATHTLTDVLALGMSMVAVKIAHLDADDNHSFGHKRVEVLSAIFNSTLLALVACWMIFQGITRLLSPETIKINLIFWVALVGVFAQLSIVLLLFKYKNDNLNVKSAYLESFADLISSIGVCIAALLIYLTGYAQLDGLIAVLIGLWCLPRAWQLFKECLHILMEGVPKDFSLDVIAKELLSVKGITGVHDLHIWAISSDHYTLTAHIVYDKNYCAQALIKEAQTHLNTLGILHTTLQFETTACEHSDNKYWTH